MRISHLLIHKENDIEEVWSYETVWRFPSLKSIQLPSFPITQNSLSLSGYPACHKWWITAVHFAVTSSNDKSSVFMSRRGGWTVSYFCFPSMATYSEYRCIRCTCICFTENIKISTGKGMLDFHCLQMTYSTPPKHSLFHLTRSNSHASIHDLSRSGLSNFYHGTHHHHGYL